MTNKHQFSINALACVLLLCCFGSTINAQVTIPADSLKKHVYFLASDSLEGRGLSTESGMIAANYIAGYFQQLGVLPVGEQYLHKFYSRMGSTMLTGHNVVGIIEGADPKLRDEYIVLGAHFDHISWMLHEGEKVVFNGADDNATGTATLLELARAIMQNKDKLKRSIVFVAFDGEESGLLGSREFVKQNTIPIDNIKLMMSIDMVGRYVESKSLIMGAMGTLEGGETVLYELADKHHIKIKKTGTEVSNRTDSKPFGDAGIPALNVTSGIVGPYHKPEDDRETIDYEGMEQIAGLLYDLTMNLSEKDELGPTIAFTKLAESNGLSFFRYGLKAGVGRSYHSYPDEFFNGKRKFTYEFGLFTKFRFTKRISLQPELLYSSTASKTEIGNFRLHSVKVPAKFVISQMLDQQINQSIFISVGAYYAYHFYGTEYHNSIDFNTNYQQTEMGITYGFGFEVPPITVSMNFNRSLNSVAKIDGAPEFNTIANYFTVGYFF